MVLILKDGSAICFETTEDGFGSISDFEATHCMYSPQGSFLCAAIGPQAQMLALGCSDGVTRLYDLHAGGALLRELSLEDWGYDRTVTGAVAHVLWTPDSQVWRPASNI